MAITTQEAIIDLEQTNALLLAAVNVSKAGIDGLIAAAVEAAGNESVLAIIQMSENSIKTQTLLLNLINN